MTRRNLKQLDMAATKVLMTILMLSIFGRAYAQCDTARLLSLNNDSIQYHLMLQTPSVDKHSTPVSKYVVRMQLDKDCKKWLLRLDSTFWLSRLNNEDKDWATNLLLYAITENNAILLFKANTREKWLPLKTKEVNMWRNVLKDGLNTEIKQKYHRKNAENRDKQTPDGLFRKSGYKPADSLSPI
jgi:hypothetical protein